MFTPVPDENKLNVDDAIDELLRDMVRHQGDSEEYAKMVDRLERLHALKEKPRRVSPDTMAVVIGNLAAVILIVGYEKANVVTSRALQFISKLR